MSAGWLVFLLAKTRRRCFTFRKRYQMKLFHHSDNGQHELSQEASLPIPLATTEALQWNLNRHFDPRQGQWMNEDPIGHADDDENLRRYVDE